MVAFLRVCLHACAVIGSTRNKSIRPPPRRIASVFRGGEYDSWQCAARAAAARARVFDGSNRFGPMLPCHVEERVNGGSK
jgi:hypothetical protein